MEQKPNLWQVGLKIGIMVALIMTIYSLLLQFMGMSQNKLLSWVSFLILIGGIVWAHKQYKESGDGYMTYAQGLGLGVIISAISGGISSLIIYLYVKFIDDSMIAQVMDQARMDMESKGMDDEQIEQTLSMTQNFMNAEMIMIMAILGSIIMGFIFSLVISAITKKTNPELEY